MAVWGSLLSVCVNARCGIYKKMNSLAYLLLSYRMQIPEKNDNWFIADYSFAGHLCFVSPFSLAKEGRFRSSHEPVLSIYTERQKEKELLPQNFLQNI